MKVSADSVAQQQLKSQNTSLKNLAVAKEQEIKGVKKIYEKKIEDQRIIGENELIDTQERNKREVADALNEKEKQLDHAQQQLKDDKARLEKERQNVADDYRERIAYTAKFFDQKNKETYDNAYAQSQEIHESKQQDVKALEGNKGIEVQKLEHDARADLNAIADSHRRRIGEQAEYYKFLQRRDQGRHDEMIEKLGVDQRKEITRQKELHTREKQDKEIIHQQEMKRQEEYHQSLLVQNKENFEKRFAQAEEQYQNTLDRIQNRFDEDTRLMMKSHTDRKHTISKKANDKFYRVQTLDHKVLDTPEAYLISLNLPEHEKETVVLSVDKRQLNFNFTRRYKDTLVDDSGAKNMTRRSEIYSKSFELPEIMDPENITREYKDGILTFKVKKA